MFTVSATEQGIRTGLADMRSFLVASGFDADVCGTTEIVLAEAMNNIAEHAFAPTGAETNEIRVTLTTDDRDLTCDIVDKGVAMPGRCPPIGQLPSLDGTANTLPEGGFGWYLIRTLTDSLSYKRHRGENHLSLRIPIANAVKDKVQSVG